MLARESDIVAGGAGLRTMPLIALTAGLLEAAAERLLAARAEVLIRDVTLDSRSVEPGALFLACRGGRRHGLEFLSEALARGARAVLYEIEPSVAAGASAPPDSLSALAALCPGEVFCAAVPRLSEHAGEIAARFFGTPSCALDVTGITGTNGKTTCAYLTAQALTHCGRPTGYLGTIGWGLPDALAPTSLTTADAVGVQRQLAALAARGARAVAMEVSSHALAQHRVDAVHFHAAAFTHLTRDHLDFHGSMQAYAAAKARLITRGELTARVINIDDAFGLELARRFAGATQSGLMLTGRERDPSAVLPGASFLRARALVCTPQGLSLTLESSFGATVLSVPLVGEFNADNALTVLGLVLAHGVPLERATQALGAVRAAPGRMELFTAPDGALAIVDYAHTPDALAKALRAARQHCRGTLRVVFGCGGDRDRGKRPLMGEAAAALADQILLTDDNPRSEDPQRIVEDIRAGVPAEVALVVEHDRARAIELALERSRQGDAVLIAGKGHEDYQIYGRERRAFSDQAVVRGLWGQVEGRA